MGAGCDEIDIGFGCDFESGAHRRIKIRVIQVTDGNPSQSKSVTIEPMEAIVMPKSHPSIKYAAASPAGCHCHSAWS